MYYTKNQIMQAIPSSLDPASRSIAEAVVKTVIENLEEASQNPIREGVGDAPAQICIRPEYLREVLTDAPPGPGRVVYTLKDDIEVDLEKMGWKEMPLESLDGTPYPDAPMTRGVARFFCKEIANNCVLNARVSDIGGKSHFDLFQNQYRFYSGPLTVGLYLVLAEAFKIPVPSNIR